MDDYNPNEKGFEELMDDSEVDPAGDKKTIIKDTVLTDLTDQPDRTENVLPFMMKRELLDLVTDRRIEDIRSFLSTNIKEPSDLSATLDKNRSFLHYAVYRGKKDIVELLITSGCRVNARDNKNRSPLHYAVGNKKIQVISTLKSNGADVNAKDGEGRTPLHYACLGGYAEIAFMLLSMDADPNVMDHFGMCPLDYCSDVMVEKTLKESFGAKHAYNGRSSFGGRLISNSAYDRKRILYSRAYQSNKKLKEAFGAANLGGEEGAADNNISHRDFLIHDILGKGSFGEVYLVENRDTANLYAMKVFSKKSVQAQNLMRFIYIEKKIMHALSHPFMVRLHFAFQTDRKLYLLMDYCKNRDLGYLLKKKKELSEQTARIVIAELVLAVEALHSQDIIHRDLKPDNILIDDDGHIKVTDFGLAKEGIRKGVLTKTFCGSIAYLPPEIIKKSGHNKMVDWYLVGIILYELLCGKPPYFSKTYAQLSWNILNAALAFPPGLSLNTKKFIKRILHRDPFQRLGAKKGAEEIKRHDFFIGIDWDQIYNREIAPFNPADIRSYTTNNYRQSIIDDAPAGAEVVDMPNWSFVAQEQ